MELLVPTGHEQEITYVEFSREGQHLISESQNAGGSTIVLWDIETRRELRQFRSSCGPATALSFDRSIMAKGCGDKIELWDVVNGHLLRTLTGNAEPVSAVALSLGSAILATVGADGQIVLWRTQDGSEIGRLHSGDTGAINSLVFDADNTTLATADDRNVIRVWNLATRTIVETHYHQYANARLLQSGKNLLMVGDKERGTFVSNVRNRKIVRRVVWPDLSYSGYALHPEHTIVAFFAYRRMFLWNGNDKEPSGINRRIGYLINRVNKTYSFSYSLDGRVFATANSFGIVDVFSLMTEGPRSLSLLRSDEAGMLNSTNHYHNEVIVSPDGKRMISRVWMGRNITQIWDLENRKEIARDNWHALVPKGIAFSSNALAASHWHPLNPSLIALIDLTTGEMIGQIESPYEFLPHTYDSINSLEFSADGKLLAAGRESGHVQIWIPETRKRLHDLPAHSSAVSSVAFSSNNELLAVGGTDGMTLWKVKSGQRIAVLGPISEPVEAVEFSPDGKMLAARSGERIRFWSVETNKEVEVKSLPLWIARNRRFGLLESNGKLFRPLFRDKQIVLTDPGSQKVLVSIFSFDDNSWLVTTPEGLFDGSPSAWEQVTWRFNNDTFSHAPVEAFFKEFYHPGLLAEILTGQIPKSTRKDLSRVDIRQARVRITSINDEALSNSSSQLFLSSSQMTRRNIPVSIEVTENLENPFHTDFPRSGGAQDLRLFRNGVLVKRWSGDLFGSQSECEQGSSKPNQPRVAICKVTVSIVAGDDLFTAYVFNHDDVKSRDATVVVEGSSSLKREGVLYVLGIGIDKYKNEAYDLQFAVADINDISQQLKTHQDQLQNYARTKIISLTDQEATKANVLLALRHFATGPRATIPGTLPFGLREKFEEIKTIQPEDALVIYYAGHGLAIGDHFYLLPHDFSANSQRELMASSVSDAELGRVLESVDAGKLLMVIDACQSGQVLGQGKEGRGPMNSKGLAQLAYDKGMYILTAAQSYQAAKEVSRTQTGKSIQHGLLTFALLEGLSKGRRDDEGWLTERSWMDYAVEQVPLMQLEEMKNRHLLINQGGSEPSSDVQAHRGAELVFTVGDNANLDPAKRNLQRPRVFYRRELESRPFIIAK